MKSILINATSCPQGGSAQVAIGFIIEALRQAPMRGWRLTLAVLPAVHEAILEQALCANARVELFKNRPGSPLSGYVARKKLKSLAKDIGADAVFTVFGPSYVRFSAPEIMGFADPFAIVPQRGCYANYPWFKIPLIWVTANMKRLLIGNAARYWVETEAAKTGLARRAWVNLSNITVIPNGVNTIFSRALKGAMPIEENEILMLGAGYPHKNHRIIPLVAEIMERDLHQESWRFVVTLPNNAPAWVHLEQAMKTKKLSHRIINLGVLNLAQCAAAYERARIVFHPSLLEVFSAGYVESMAAKRPLVASDRSFAREICGAAAKFVEPTDASDCAKAILSLLSDPMQQNALIDEGRIRLRDFPDGMSKNERLCNLIGPFTDS